MGRGSLCLFHVRHASAVFSAHSGPTNTADVAVATLNPECEESHLVTNGATELRGNGRDLERAACRLATVDTDSKCVETLTDPANSIAAPVNAILAVVEGVAQREAGGGDSGGAAIADSSRSLSLRWRCRCPHRWRARDEGGG